MIHFNLNYVRMLILFCIGLISIGTSSCQEKSSTQNDIQLLSSFNENVLLKDSLDLDTIYEYVTIHPSLKNDKNFSKTLKYILWTFKENREKNPRTSGFDTYVPYAEMKEKYAKWANLKPFKNLDYEDYDRVYYGINQNTTEKLGLFVVKNGKIISFFPYIHMGADPVRPFLLNEPADEKYIKVFNKYVGAE